MTLLEMVQKAIRKSGAKVDVPTTVSGATGLVELFVEWVQDAWKEIQLERLGWHWRVLRDQVMAITSATDEYDMPSTLESINLRTVTIYSAVADEALMSYISYDEWRRRRDLATRATGRPTCFCITPNDKLALYPQPDDTYTLRYDGILKVEILDNTNDNATPTNIADEYQDGIVWLAVQHYAQHFEDGSKFQEARDRFIPYKKYYEERSMPDVSVNTTAMYNRTGY